MTTAKVIIKKSLRMLGIIGEEEEPTPGEYADALSRAAATGYYVPPRPAYERTMEEARLDQQ